MVIFHSYVSLPEGNPFTNPYLPAILGVFTKTRGRLGVLTHAARPRAPVQAAKAWLAPRNLSLDVHGVLWGATKVLGS